MLAIWNTEELLELVECKETKIRCWKPFKKNENMLKFRIKNSKLSFIVLFYFHIFNIIKKSYFF